MFTYVTSASFILGLLQKYFVLVWLKETIWISEYFLFISLLHNIIGIMYHTIVILINKISNFCIC